MRIFLPFRLLIDVLKRTTQQFEKDQVGDLAAALTWVSGYSSPVTRHPSLVTRLNRHFQHV